MNRQFARSNSWALASDGIQWVIQRAYLSHGKLAWHSISYMRTKAVIARDLREDGCPPEDAEKLLGALPETFDAWLTRAAPRELATAVAEEAALPQEPGR
jgi:hypothetical protein